MDYALDANVFIEASRRYYSFAICPGFWQSLVHHHAQGHIFSIDRVKAEMAGKRRKVPIPNVCAAFDVEYLDTFEMLKALGTTYHWKAPG